ncbi:MAG: hypothetical protein KDD10_24120 [Phaeodactylibacter sp.]|nr:hypothetical protein [Phaeodactylibacter sp.]
METSKLLDAVRALEEPEQSRLRQFAASPYFNEQEELIRLLDYILRFGQGFEGRGLAKENAFQHLFPGMPYEDKRMRYLMSGLNQLVEQFLAAERSRKQENHYRLALLEAVSERGLEKAYRQTLRKLESSLAAEPYRGGAFFYHRMRQAETEERHFQLQRRRKYDESIQFASDYLDRFYFLQKLKYACIMLDRQAILQGSYELNIGKEWEAHLRSRAFFDEPIISLYYTILQALLEEGKESYFRVLRKSLADPGPGIPPGDLQDIYLFAINYCARKIRQGREDYIGQALQLYLDGIQSEILIDNGQLSPWAFTNVVKLALRLRRYHWIEHFIQRYAPALPEAFRENALHYNLAELYYYTNRFEQAQEHLKQVAYSDLNYYLGGRVILAKIYYENEEVEPLLSLLAAFTIFLKRNKLISSDLKQTYLNFCDILFQIVKGKRRHWKKLGKKIQETRLLTDREWLQSVYKEASLVLGI